MMYYALRLHGDPSSWYRMPRGTFEAIIRIWKEIIKSSLFMPHGYCSEQTKAALNITVTMGVVDVVVSLHVTGVVDVVVSLHHVQLMSCVHEVLWYMVS